MQLAVRTPCAARGSPTTPSISPWRATCSAASGCAVTASSGPSFVCKDGPVFSVRRRSRLCSERAAYEAAPRRVQVRLLRRLPAADPQRRGRRCSALRRTRSTSPTSPRRAAASVRGPYDIALVEGSITTPHDARRIAARARRQPLPGHHRRLRHGRRHPGAAQLGGHRGVQARRLPEPRVHHRARRPRRRSPSTSRSTSRSGAAPSTRASCSPCSARCSPARGRPCRRTASAWSASGAGATCVVVAHGEPCLGPVTRTGCGAICPQHAARLLRLLRTRRRPQHGGLSRSARAPGARAGRGRAPPARHQRLRASACGTASDEIEEGQD